SNSPLPSRSVSLRTSAPPSTHRHSGPPTLRAPPSRSTALHHPSPERHGGNEREELERRPPRGGEEQHTHPRTLEHSLKCDGEASGSSPDVWEIMAPSSEPSPRWWSTLEQLMMPSSPPSLRSVETAATSRSVRPSAPPVRSFPFKGADALSEVLT
ncbi:unnamed protein product, partial [Arctogadus glacialis]